MSAGFVVDASVGFSWVYENQATEETDWLLNEVILGANVVVPTVWFLEIANVFLMAQRRHKLTLSERRTALASLEALPITVDEEGHRTAFHKTSELAQKHGLTIYDAAYLEVALRRNLPVATRDELLKAAAKKSGAKMLGERAV